MGSCVDQDRALAGASFLLSSFIIFPCTDHILFNIEKRIPRNGRMRLFLVAIEPEEVRWYFSLFSFVTRFCFISFAFLFSENKNKKKIHNKKKKKKKKKK